jgi:two-component system cell cycle sensor histidine kinase/response regulator CckA
LIVNRNKILVVDDYADTLNLTVEYLEKSGFRAEGYTDPLLALEEFRKDPNEFDLIIMDVNLPSIDGLELYSKLKQVRKNVNIYLFTGWNVDVSKFQKTCDSFRGEHLIYKPIRMHSLLNTIHSAIGN